MDLSIIIVNYNSSNDLRNCLTSIYEHVKNVSYEIIVVDNNSSGFNAAIFPRCESASLKIYPLNENIGFGRANNLGVSKASGDIIYLLNPDTQLIENIFPEVKRIFQENEEISICGTRLIDKQNNIEKSGGYFPKIGTEFLNVFHLSNLFEKHNFDMKIRGSHNIIPFEWVTGASLFIRKDVYMRIGGFDSNYFLYNEDIDLCYRVVQSGGKIVLLSNLTVIHSKSVSSRKDYYLFTINSYESKFILISKVKTRFSGFLIKKMIFLQLFLQSFLWIILIPLNYVKYIGKLRALPRLIKLFLFG